MLNDQRRRNKAPIGTRLPCSSSATSPLLSARKSVVSSSAPWGTAHGKTHEKIAKYLRFGKRRRIATSCTTFEGIEKQLRIVYSQCVVKYAYKIDAAIKRAPHLHGDDQSEGQAPTASP